MTEIQNKNRQNYLDLCNKVWNLDDESMKYLEKRLSDDWEPVPEFKTLIDALKEKGATYEDQRVMIDIDVADNLVISDISNAEIDINKATNVDNYLLNIDESQCDLMSFCQFLKTNESYFLADCNKLSKEVLKLIINEKKDSAIHLVNSCESYDSYSLVNSIKYFTQQLDVSLSDSLKMCCENVCAMLNINDYGSIQIDKAADLLVIDEKYNISLKIEKGKIL